MTKVTSIITATLLSTTFAAGAMAADLSMDVATQDNLATVSLTQNGQAVANYPVQIQGQTYLTSEDGTLTYKNYAPTARTLKIVAEDNSGDLIVKQGFVARDDG